MRRIGVDSVTGNEPSHASARSAQKTDARDIIGEAIESAADHDLLGLAAETAFRSALTVLPFLLFLVALPSVIGDIFSINDLAGSLSQEAGRLLSKNSAQIVDTIIKEITRSGGWTALLFGLSGTLFAGSASISTVRKALNRVYGFDDRTPFLQRKTREVVITVAVGALLVCAVASVALLPLYLHADGLGFIFGLVIGVLFVLVAVSLIYWLAPAADNSFRWVTPGSLIFAAGWLLFSLGFSAYLSRFGMVNKVYGSLGAMIVLLIWLYGTNIALLIGAEVNAALGRRFDDKVQRESVN